MRPSRRPRSATTPSPFRVARVAALLCCLIPFGARAAEDAELETAAARAVEKGLAALVAMQGSDGNVGGNVAITALAGMALLAGGHTPTRGAYREASARCLRYVLDQQSKLTGYLGTRGGRMYGHGFATLYLAECYGMTPTPRLRRAVDAALDLIYRSQNSEGGWRYEPVPVDADISITICQIMAIRAAYNCGIAGDRSQEVIGRAVSYVRQCATGNGTFTYTAGGGSWNTTGVEAVPRCAAGCMCLIGSGVNDLDDPVLGPSMSFLRRHVVANIRAGGNYYWYGQYYASQAMFHSPREQNEDWQLYWRAVVPQLISFQDGSGRWSQPSSHGDAYATSIALIILQIDNHYLPIFQR